ncbi:MarR family transcriptional regulator [Oerskovia sp. Sa1BUA8]|uniref:MarR family transcriptional regulator n=1 Tax=Oerskovia douganii TaxID=2762210 RepID=A0A9D5UGH7_9CELL|nr:MarR family transcriptional regulator [Oerskovia douganii]MBE7700457.1 MarR family transcriptional regulator [Oerskovia douganii]
MTTDIDAENAEFLTLLHAAMRAVRREAGERLGRARTTPGQYRMLRALAHCDGPQRPSALACMLDVAPRSVTSKVDDAEAAGLVRRLPDPTDRRATLVELTEDGRRTLAAVAAERETSAGTLLSRLDADDRHELIRLLRVVADEPGPAPGRAHEA